MITWLGTKLFLKKAWAWLKTYWYIPLLASWLIIAWLVFRKDNAEDILDVFYEAEQSYKKQIEAIEKAHAEEIKKRDKALSKYQRTIEQLEKELERRRMHLKDAERERIRELSEEFKNKPDEYTKRIAEEFGFEFVE